jgi:hypothetical protein
LEIVLRRSPCGPVERGIEPPTLKGRGQELHALLFMAALLEKPREID